MASKATTKPKGIILFRPKRQMTRLPVAILGYNHLIEPDEYQGTRKFKGNFHYGDKAWEKFEAIVEKRCSELMDGYLKECENKDWTPPSNKTNVKAWVADKRKAVKSDKSDQKDDFIQIGLKEYVGEDKKTGKEWRNSIKAWAAKDGSLLDIAKLCPSSGTVCVPIVEIGLFSNREYAEATPSIRLIGIQIIKLERFQGGSVDAVSDDDIEGWDGDDLDFEDLSAFTGAGLNDDTEDDKDGADEKDSGEPPV